MTELPANGSPSVHTHSDLALPRGRFVSASAEFEGLPLALLEAMAAGAPCAVTETSRVICRFSHQRGDVGSAVHFAALGITTSRFSTRSV
jgi:hypothetical protein